MPLARLISKLSNRDSANSRGANDTGAAEMDYGRSPTCMVTAEMLLQHQGERSRSLCSSSLSSAVSAEAVLNMPNSMPPDQILRSNNPPPAPTASILLDSLAGSSAAAAAAPAAGPTSHTASLRVMRAMSKAAMRGQTLGADGQHSSLDRSMSIEPQQGCTLFAFGSSGGAHCVPHRAATDSVSLWVATGSITHSAQLPQLLAARGSVPADDDDNADDDHLLASPLSPGVGAAAGADPHCEWEDGVVAGWLDGIDPAELMHDEDELHQPRTQPQPQPQLHKQQQQQPQPQQRAVSLCRAGRTDSAASATLAAPEVVFGSLLYS